MQCFEILFLAISGVLKTSASILKNRSPHSYSEKFYKKCPGCKNWIRKRTTLCRVCARKKNFDLEVLDCKEADAWIRAKWRPGNFDELEEKQYERAFQEASWW